MFQCSPLRRSTQIGDVRYDGVLLVPTIAMDLRGATRRPAASSHLGGLFTLGDLLEAGVWIRRLYYIRPLLEEGILRRHVEVVVPERGYIVWVGQQTHVNLSMLVGPLNLGHGPNKIRELNGLMGPMRNFGAQIGN